MHMDIFTQNGFSVMEMTGLVSRLPFAPTRLRELGWFAERGSRSTVMSFELRNGVLTLVPDAPRGAPGVLKNPQRRGIEYISASHLPQRVHVFADEIQGLRAAGSESEVVTMQNYLQEKMEIPKQDNDLTIEFQRIGAVKGVVMDADGTTPLVNLFTKFGVTQQTQDMDLANASADIQNLIIAAKRKSEAKLGALMPRGWRALCSEGFFDEFIKRADVKEAFLRYNESAFLRDDPRAGFEFGKVIWEEYRGAVGTAAFIEDGEAYLVPEGIPGLFTTYYAPANYMDTVNQPGVPYYASVERMDHNIGVEVQVQSNPLNICVRPDAIVKLTET